MIPTAKPKGPALESVFQYIRELDSRRVYSNQGPLVRELEYRCAFLLGVDPHCVVTASSGTAALIALLLAEKKYTSGICAMPAWTYSATAAGALQAGLTPYFLDVDEDTWSLDPDNTIARAKGLSPAAILPVAPFGTKLQWDAWEYVATKTDVPVVIDAAAAFDVIASTKMVSNISFMVSLHATKLLGCGEGGIAVVKNRRVAEEVRRFLNFGFFGERTARVQGFNGKLSEYHAAVGLAALDEWAIRREQWLEAKRLLRRNIIQIPGIKLGPDAVAENATSTFNVIIDSNIEKLQSLLKKNSIGSLRWWGSGCAKQPAYSKCPTDPLPVTNLLSQRVLGLPFFCDISRSEVGRIGDALEQFTTQKHQLNQEIGTVSTA
ncbi:DegT/DnrJ/EryC1/StrS family aminotransferase [Roseibium sp.]|uniref:DegT/DnrJ/EryC1/StrS family aminotransferase n=1 Tax=Roseibium sp. TaxID=1936156 RepID=UPI003B503217